MRLYLFLLIILLFTNCYSQDVMTKVDYKHKGNRYSLNIPEGYEHKGISGDHELEMQFWYPDSSVIYITDDKNISNVNYEKIYVLKEQYYKRQFLTDTLELSGRQSGLFWKDIKKGNISVGYANVPKKKRALFDKALKSLRKIR